MGQIFAAVTLLYNLLTKKNANSSHPLVLQLLHLIIEVSKILHTYLTHKIPAAVAHLCLAREIPAAVAHPPSCSSEASGSDCSLNHQTLVAMDHLSLAHQTSVTVTFLSLTRQTPMAVTLTLVTP